MLTLTKKITVEVKNVYGNETIYPACITSSRLAELAGTKTLTPYALTVIRSLGYEICVKQPELQS